MPRRAGTPTSLNNPQLPAAILPEMRLFRADAEGAIFLTGLGRIVQFELLK
jgi:hypothetical protein